MNKKVKIFLFLNGKYGGVYSVIKNIIHFSKNSSFEYHIVNIVGKNTKQDFNYVDFLGLQYQHFFEFDSRNNFYSTCRQIAKLFSDTSSIIVANDWIELGMVSLLGLNNPVLHIVHGNYDYYFDLVKKHNKAVNLTLCVSESILKNLVKDNPEITNKIGVIKYPVMSGESTAEKLPGLNILFIAADLKSGNKNLIIIKSINSYLESESVRVNWHLVGNGFAQNEIKEWWSGNYNSLTYYGFLSANDLKKLYSKTNIFLLPSLQEGLPVSMIEAMNFNLVPIVNSWNNSAESIINNGHNGCIVNTNNSFDYAQHIIYFYQNPDKLVDFGEKAKKTVLESFNNDKSIQEFEQKILDISLFINKRAPLKVYGSRLDNKYIPNLITKTIRTVLN